MKKVLFTIITDLHVSESTLDEVLECVRKACEKTVELGLYEIFVLGDVFQSRVSQRQSLITFIEKMFDLFEQYDLTANVIPGNHDKTDYESTESFLSPYKHHPAVRLFEKPTLPLSRGDYDIYMFPFFKFGTEIHDKYFGDILSMLSERKRPSVLLGHMAPEGAVNNDGSKVTGGMKRSTLKPFNKCFFGHYHNTHEVGKNVVQCPCLRQNNYGEDANKGMTIVYDDLSYDIFHLGGTPYKIYRFDLSDGASVVDMIDVANAVADQLDKGSNIRFEILGSDETIRGLDTTRFVDGGIEVKKKYKSLEPTELSEDVEAIPNLQVWTANTITDKFVKFCETNELDKEKGIELLDQIITENNGKEK